jgi:hypothetical protein
MPQGSLTCLKTYDTGLRALLYLRRKSWYGFLSQLKIHCSRPGLDPRTLGPMASTITARPPRTTRLYNSAVSEVYVLYRIKRCDIKSEVFPEVALSPFFVYMDSSWVYRFSSHLCGIRLCVFCHMLGACLWGIFVFSSRTLAPSVPLPSTLFAYASNTL